MLHLELKKDSVLPPDADGVARVWNEKGEFVEVNGARISLGGSSIDQIASFIKKQKT